MAHAGEVLIVSAARTAIGRFGGGLSTLSAPQLGATVVANVVERAGVPPEGIDEILMGCVLQAGVGQAPARQAAIAAGLPSSVPATTINKVCGSGLKAAMLGAAMIRCGDADCIVAGGMESMSGAPHLLPGARRGYRLGHAQALDALIHDGLWCSFENHHMGESAEWVARRFGLTRGELDAYALRSHQRAVAAVRGECFAQEITPVLVPRRSEAPVPFTVDECPRPDTNLCKLDALPPVFRPDGLVTAGNASGIADGAAALVLASKAYVSRLASSPEPLARIVAYGQAAVEPLAIFTAPAIAIRDVLGRTGLGLDDIDLFELNEAFAAQTLANLRALGLNEGRVNVHGGAIALGHPVGASGARVLVTLLYALKRRGASRGIAALCLGGGEAVAMMVEMI